MFQNTAYRIAAAVCFSRLHGHLPARLRSRLEVAYFRGPSPLNLRQRAGMWLMSTFILPRHLVALAFWLARD